MADERCSHFQQHAWKSDACANCLKPKLQHGSSPEMVRPTPARRQSKEPTAVTGKTSDATNTVVEEIRQGSKLENNVKNESVSEDTIVTKDVATSRSDAKPSPIKAKPSIGSKPILSQKPLIIGKDNSSNAIVAADTSEIIAKRSERSLNLDHPEEASENSRSVESKCSAKEPTSYNCENKLPSDPTIVLTNDYDANMSICAISPATFSSESKTSHYYQVYDITARNKEEETLFDSAADVRMGTSNSKTAMQSSRRARAMQLVEVAEEQIAMPYNVVDVTIRRPKASDWQPQLPLTPAPTDIIGFNGNTWPTKHPSSGREAPQSSSPVPRQRSTKVTESSEAEAKANIIGTHTQDNDIIVSSSDHCFDRYAHRVYEDIEDAKTSASILGRNGQQCLTRATGAKSAAFEARVAALSTLDLGKPSNQKQVQAVSSSSDISEDVKSDEVMASPNKTKADNVLVEISKSDKVRKKEGGKSFFHKLLKFGSRDVRDAKEITVVSDCGEQVCHVQKNTNGTVADACNTVCFPVAAETSTADISVSSAPSPIPNPVVTIEKQAVLMNLKDCLVKRQMSTCVANAACPSTVSVSNVNLHCENFSEHADVILKGEKASFLVKDEAPVPEISCPVPISSASSTKIQSTQISSDILATPIVQMSTTDTLEQNSKEDSVSSDMHGSSGDVIGLSVVTDSMPVLESFASPCSSSDAVSPTPSDQCSEGTDHLTRRKSRAEQKPGKQLRKTLGAPPPPPPTSPALVSEHDSSSLNDHGRVDFNMSSTPPSVLVMSGRDDHSLAIPEVLLAADHVTRSELTQLSHSLPRPISRKSPGGSSKSGGSDLIVRRLDSAAKHTRNKTVSEGIKFEDQLWSNGVTDNKTDEERLLEIVEKRASKFLNRALPEPPTAECGKQSLTSPVGQSSDGAQVTYNMYELVSPTDSKTHRKQAGETYEEIDAMSDATSSSVVNRSPSNCNHGNRPSASLKQNSPCAKPVVDAEYLEPVLPANENASTTNWRPSPAPRVPLPAVRETLNNQTMYANFVDENISAKTASEIPVTLDDCFSEMNKITLETLRCIAQRKYAANLNYMMTNSMELAWLEFEMGDSVAPNFSQNQVSFYRSWHQTVAPNGCVLMVLNMKPAKPICEHLHLNVLSPIATFHESRFVDNSSNLDQNFENVAVLPFTDVMRFDEYWRKQHKLVLSGNLQAAYVERAICRTLANLLSAAIFLHNCGWPKPRLDWNHVFMASTLAQPSGDFLPMLRPSMKATAASSIEKVNNVCADVHQLVSIMLEPDVVETEIDASDKLLCGSAEEDSSSKPTVRRVDLSSFLMTDSPYARCLQRVLRCLQQRLSSVKWDAAVCEALRLLEFVLWGPTEQEARLAAVSERRDEDLRKWLALSRCRLLAQLVVEEKENLTAIELIHKAQFLCDVTEGEMLDVTKLLFFDP